MFFCIHELLSQVQLELLSQVQLNPPQAKAYYDRCLAVNTSIYSFIHSPTHLEIIIWAILLAMQSLPEPIHLGMSCGKYRFSPSSSVYLRESLSITNIKLKWVLKKQSALNKVTKKYESVITSGSPKHASLKMVYPEPCKELNRRPHPFTVDCPLLPPTPLVFSVAHVSLAHGFPAHPAPTSYGRL